MILALVLVLCPPQPPDLGIKRDMGGTVRRTSPIAVVKVGGGAYKVTPLLYLLC